MKYQLKKFIFAILLIPVSVLLNNLYALCYILKAVGNALEELIDSMVGNLPHTLTKMYN